MRLLTALLATTVLAAATPEADLPNIILIYADDLGWGDVSAYGATAIKTPEIDRLAKEGIRFTSGYAGSSTCTPSRFAMLTGEYAWRAPGRGIAPADEPLVIKPATTTLPAILREAGYHTAVIGKWHLGLGDGNIDWNGKIAPGPLEIGFDYSFLIPATVDRVPCVFVENHHVVGLDPADPIKVDYRKRIDPRPSGEEARDTLKMDWSHGHNSTIVNGISRIGWMTGGTAALWKDEDIADEITRRAVAHIEAKKDERFFLFFTLHDPHVPRVPHPRFVGSTGMGPRGDVIAQIDWCVGEINRTLDRLGLTENTLVIVSSDNGPVLDDGYKDDSDKLIGDHKPAGPFRGFKYGRWEGSNRVPFILRWPARIPAGQVSDAIVGQVDFPASFAALTGRALKESEFPDSFNVLPALLDSNKSGRPSIVLEGIRNILGYRSGDWKYHEPTKVDRIAWGAKIDIGARPEPMLYHLATDPGEAKNVADEHPEIVGKLHAELQQIKSSGRSRP
jgi:arylsulfatase A-like enzyme